MSGERPDYSTGSLTEYLHTLTLKDSRRPSPRKHELLYTRDGCDAIKDEPDEGRDEPDTGNEEPDGGTDDLQGGTDGRSDLSKRTASVKDRIWPGQNEDLPAASLKGRITYWTGQKEDMPKYVEVTSKRCNDLFRQTIYRNTDCLNTGSKVPDNSRSLTDVHKNLPAPKALRSDENKTFVEDDKDLVDGTQGLPDEDNATKPQTRDKATTRSPIQVHGTVFKDGATKRSPIQVHGTGFKEGATTRSPIQDHGIVFRDKMTTRSLIQDHGTVFKDGATTRSPIQDHGTMLI